MLENFKEYYRKAKMMQELHYQDVNWTESDVNDDLIWNVPIYDVVNRRYAAFSSLPEAIWEGSEDTKGNGLFFLDSSDRISDKDFVTMCYLFRLCGSGINYKPKISEIPFGSHGFGNFWVVDELKKGISCSQSWIDHVPEKGFCDVKGYLLPMIKGGLRNFIKQNSQLLVDYLYSEIFSSDKKLGIKEVVDSGNKWLMHNGFKRQNFVLTAFAMDMAEYFPEQVDRDSDVYVGSNARKCLKLILPGMKHDKALRYLCDILDGDVKPMDIEDVACDFIRYLEDFQSPAHIEMNNGIKYKKNVI